MSALPAGALAVDHLVYAAPDLEGGVAILQDLIGVRAAPGGRHPGRGTRNALIALGPRTYLEILAPDPQQPPSARRWFRIDDLGSPRLAGWAASVENLEEASAGAARAGLRLGDIQAGSRRRPDGVLLTWRLTDPGAVSDAVVPFLIDWGKSPHPAQTAPRGARLAGLRAAHPDPAAVSRRLRALGVDLPVGPGREPALIAVIEGPKGRVELR